jgi:hypothetical protein
MGGAGAQREEGGARPRPERARASQQRRLLEAALWSSGGRELGLGAVLPEEQRVCGGEEIKGREYASCFLFFFEGVVCSVFWTCGDQLIFLFSGKRCCCNKK